LSFIIIIIIIISKDGIRMFYPLGETGRVKWSVLRVQEAQLSLRNGAPVADYTRNHWK